MLSLPFLRSCAFVVLSIIASAAAFAQSTPDTLRHAVYFERGSTAMSRAEQQALTQFIAKVADSSLLEWRLVGFADSVGSTGTNRAICLRRVQAVATAVKVTHLSNHHLQPLQQVAVGEVPEVDQAKARRVEVLAVRASAGGSFMTGALGSLLRHLDVDGQKFTVNPKKATILRATGGAELHLPVGAYGAVGPVTVMIKEYRTLREAALAGLTTTSGEALLGTGGMFYLEARDGTGKRVELVQPVELRVPKAQAGDTTYPMQGFQGKREPDGYPDWVASGGDTTQMTNPSVASQASQGGLGCGMGRNQGPFLGKGYVFSIYIRDDYEFGYNSNYLQVDLLDFCAWKLPDTPNYPKRQAEVYEIFKQEQAAVVLAQEICFRVSQMESLREHVKTLKIKSFQRTITKLTGTYKAKRLAANKSRNRSFLQINRMRLECDSLYKLLGLSVKLADSLYEALPIDTFPDRSLSFTGCAPGGNPSSGPGAGSYYNILVSQGGYINFDYYPRTTNIIAQTISEAPQDIPTIYTIVLPRARIVLPCRPKGRDRIETPRGPKGAGAVLVGVREREDGTFEVARVPFRIGDRNVKAVFKPVGTTREAVDLALIDLD